jgi:hypothetical protein
MTLGCGGYGGNITSDNISPRHLLNIKRIAYEIVSVPNRFERAGGRTGAEAASLPSAPKPPTPAGVGADALSARIDQFLASRGYQAERAAPKPPGGAPRPTVAPDEKALDFVCEEDVRLAIQAGRQLVISEQAIVTPAARDLGEPHRVFIVAPWSG